MIIGPQPGGANAGDSANVIHLVDVASHANSATQSLAALHGLRVTNVRNPGKQQDIAFLLMISLRMEMLDSLICVTATTPGTGSSIRSTMTLSLCKWIYPLRQHRLRSHAVVGSFDCGANRFELFRD
jgi:hypothetical protein